MKRGTAENTAGTSSTFGSRLNPFQSTERLQTNGRWFVEKFKVSQSAAKRGTAADTVALSDLVALLSQSAAKRGTAADATVGMIGGGIMSQSAAKRGTAADAHRTVVATEIASQSAAKRGTAADLSNEHWIKSYCLNPLQSAERLQTLRDHPRRHRGGLNPLQSAERLQTRPSPRRAC